MNEEEFDLFYKEVKKKVSHLKDTIKSRILEVPDIESEIVLVKKNTIIAKYQHLARIEYETHDIREFIRNELRDKDPEFFIRVTESWPIKDKNKKSI